MVEEKNGEKNLDAYNICISQYVSNESIITKKMNAKT